jgi:DNA-binding NtrC family response regulator
LRIPPGTGGSPELRARRSERIRGAATAATTFSGGARMSQVLILEPRETPIGCRALLAGLKHHVDICGDRTALLEALSIRRPDLVIYVLNDLPSDLAFLSLLRRISSSLPIIVLGADSSLEARRSVQDMRPTYFGVFPLEPCELANAVRSALSHRKDPLRP